MQKLKKVTNGMTAKTKRYFYFGYNRINFIKRGASTMVQTHTPMKT